MCTRNKKGNELYFMLLKSVWYSCIWCSINITITTVVFWPLFDFFSSSSFSSLDVCSLSMLSFWLVRYPLFRFFFIMLWNFVSMCVVCFVHCVQATSNIVYERKLTRVRLWAWDGLNFYFGWLSMPFHTKNRHIFIFIFSFWNWYDMKCVFFFCFGALWMCNAWAQREHIAH